MHLRKNAGRFCLVLLAVVVSTAFGQQRRADHAKRDFEDSLHGGKTVVLVVAPVKGRQADDDEAHGDWASYLNDFAGGTTGDTRILKLTSNSFSHTFSQPKLVNKYAVLFVKDRSHALVYDGLVVEPGVYTAGTAYLSGKRDETAESAFGLHESVLYFKKP